MKPGNDNSLVQTTVSDSYKFYHCCYCITVPEYHNMHVHAQYSNQRLSSSLSSSSSSCNLLQKNRLTHTTTQIK